MNVRVHGVLKCMMCLSAGIAAMYKFVHGPHSLHLVCSIHSRSVTYGISCIYVMEYTIQQVVQYNIHKLKICLCLLQLGVLYQRHDPPLHNSCALQAIVLPCHNHAALGNHE